MKYIKHFIKKFGKKKALKARDPVPLKGILSVTKIHKDGSTELIFKEENLITLAAKVVVLSTVYLTSFSPDPIATLQVGIGGTIDPGGLYPQTPTSLATSLYNYLLSVPISYTTNAAVPSVTFLATLDESTGNGSSITEAGLFKQSGLIFNIKTFPAVPKTAEFSLYFQWTIEMA